MRVSLTIPETHRRVGVISKLASGQPWTRDYAVPNQPEARQLSTLCGLWISGWTHERREWKQQQQQQQTIYTTIWEEGRRYDGEREGGKSLSSSNNGTVVSIVVTLLLCSELSALAWTGLLVFYLFIVRSVQLEFHCVSDGGERVRIIFPFNCKGPFSSSFTWSDFLFDEILLKQQQTTTDPVIIIQLSLSWLSGSKTIARSSPKNLYMSLIVI